MACWPFLSIASLPIHIGGVGGRGGGRGRKIHSEKKYSKEMI